MAAVCGGLAIGFGGFIAAAALISVPIIVLIVGVAYRSPKLLLYATLLAAFFSAGLKRYVPAPTGLAVDFLLALCLLVVLFDNRQRWDWSRARNPLTVMIGLWTFYCVLQLMNPEAPSPVAWFYAVRAEALYWIVGTPLAFVLLSRRRDLDHVIAIWLAVSVVAVLWGMKQLYVGLDPFESAWLFEPKNRLTHLLFGKLRVFSFYSDSGQFGAAMGHAAVVAVVLALGPGSLKRRAIAIGAGLLCLYGMFLSGTRGAMAVPFVGLCAYFVMSRNWKILIPGFMALVVVFGLLRYTYVGHNVYEIRRMRTAFIQGADNPSLRVRVENQKLLAAYLEDHPFGGGVGSVGYWGRRFSPGTFLADFPPDSWYVKIAAEHGPVGLALHLGVLAGIMFMGGIRISRETDLEIRQKLLALYSGTWGVLVSSYGNEVLGQMPTGILVTFSFAFFFMRDYETSDQPIDRRSKDLARSSKAGSA
jgi:hypothetical protein